jgi:hypothetical protein
MIMDITGHSVNALLIYTFVYFLGWHNFPPNYYPFLVLLFGYLPDFDGIYWRLTDHHFDTSFQHHLYLKTHYPITYLPLVVLFLVTIIFNFHPDLFLIFALGPYVHLACDSIGGGDGIMWGKTWNKDQFARYFNFGATLPDGYHGKCWKARWHQTNAYKITRVVAFCIIFVIIGVLIGYGFNLSYFLVILYFIITLSIDFIPIDPKFLAEPPEGRYSDYRKHPGYLAWMQKAGYEFDANMHVKKIKKLSN